MAVEGVKPQIRVAQRPTVDKGNEEEDRNADGVICITNVRSGVYKTAVEGGSGRSLLSQGFQWRNGLILDNS